MRSGVRERQRAATRERLFAAALAEFRRNGFERANVAEIARAAGVSRPSFYAHFPTLDHVLRDFSEGPEWSKRQHYDEWTRLVNKRSDPSQVNAETQRLIDMKYSIHFHVWSAPELLDLVQTLRRIVEFELELFLRNGIESLIILRKAS